MYHFLPRSLPEGLEGLTELALDVRWTWSHAGDALWRALDPEVWEQTKSPWAILQNMSSARLQALARDTEFKQELARVEADRRRYLEEPAWCAQGPQGLGLGTVAYFSMEFGLSEAFPLYAGGLGILAGDCLKTASDLGVPLVGVGLLYQEGYFRQTVDANGRQEETYPYNDPTSLPIQPVIDREGDWLRVELKLPGRTLHLRVWQASVGRVRLYLLDSNDMLNGPRDRSITAKLYGDGAERRLQQEMVLGIGGWAALEKLGIEADVCHLNEGHAAFAVVERACQFMLRHGVSFSEAWWAVRAGTVFTTHTPVAAGFDVFPPDLVRQNLRGYLADFDPSPSDLLALGRKNPLDDAEPFNMTYLALRGSARANGVSRLHAQVSRGLFADLYPGWPQCEVPIGHVTNGVHVPSWDSLWADRLWTEACGKRRWLGTAENVSDTIAGIDDETFWKVAAEERNDLVRYARGRVAWQLGQRGAAQEKVGEALGLLDPNILTLGFARRFAEYKRPNLLLHDPERLARLLTNAKFPVQIIVAGKAHPADAQGKRMIEAWIAFVNRSDVRARAVFLEDYDMGLAQEMVQGVDVWISTSRRPWEACGTSGMKVLANGGLNLSTLDGWWAEAWEPDVGWAIASPQGAESSGDAADAEVLYRLLEEEVVPLFYQRDARGVPVGWVRRMRASIAKLAPRFSSNRMLQQYLSHYYRPAAAEFRRRSSGGGTLARELCAWHERLRASWRQIHFGGLRAEQREGQWHFDVQVYLGEIPRESVRVELYAEPEHGDDPVREPMTRAVPIPGAVNGYVYSGSVSAQRPDWHFTPRVVAWHPEVDSAAELGLIAWQR